MLRMGELDFIDVLEQFVGLSKLGIPATLYNRKDTNPKEE